MNQLVHIDEFRKLLADYHMSADSLEVLRASRLTLLVAPTSSGRNTIIKELLKTGNYYYIVSDTTREKRVNDGIPEQDGVEYWFRSEDAVLADIKAGKYLEAAVIHNQQVSGISIRELHKATEAGKIALTDAEVNGAENALLQKPDTLAIFVLPPSFEEWQKRLKERGVMDPAEYKRRMQSAAIELQAAMDHDYYKFVINNTVSQAAANIQAMAQQGVIDPELQRQSRELARQLLVQTQRLVASL